MKKILLGILLIVLLFIAYLAFNTVRFKSRQLDVQAMNTLDVPEAAVSNFIEALKIKTISNESGEIDSTAFRSFNEFIQRTYPLADSILNRKSINEFSHLFKWVGANEDLKPMVLMSHLDVVPVIEENLDDWKQDPFGGNIVDGVIWGRGTIDDKIGVIGILEAVESLLQQGFAPERTIYLAFGHDEETLGTYGAIPIARLLEEEGVEAEFVLDEGGVIAQRLVPGIEKDVALIGVAEKGFVSFELEVAIDGGHSSRPAKETAIDVLSGAIKKLKDNPLEPRISGPLRGFFDFLGPEMTLTNKVVFANSGLLSSVIIGIYTGIPEGNAMVRTVTSPTIFNSGVKENVIPRVATAVVNFRILPGETIEDIEAHVIATVDDERVNVNQKGHSSNPSIVSPTESFGFEMIHQSIAEIYPGTVVGPNLIIAATDSRHFEGVSDNIYRFAPIKVNPDNVGGFHGINERIPVSEFEDGIRFYIQVIKNGSKSEN